MKNVIYLFILIFTLIACNQTHQNILVSTAKYSVYCDSVVQTPFIAIAKSDRELYSNYKSLKSDQISSLIRFKFSINSRDNEMSPGLDHYITLQPVNGLVTTPPIKFGKQYIDTSNIEVSNLPKNTRWTVQLDLREMLKSFKENGFYVFFNGSAVYASDFKGVYIAGATSPLIWDFENLCNTPGALMQDENKDGIYDLTLILNPEQEKTKNSTWKLSQDISAFPRYQSDQLIVDALYNLSLEEMVKNIRTDSTFMAGEKWEGVWTRDISYAINLSLAIVNPEISKKSLLRKVKNKRIIQDTGSGGSWPISTDRVTWALAAWEVYKVTGDNNWLSESFEIIKNSVNDDRFAALDEKTGLICGESSFLDWREQTYPKWMEPIDIYESKNLGTNAVHYQTYMILSEMAELLGEPSDSYKEIAKSIKSGVNKYLWMPDKGYYAQFLYGFDSNEISFKSESLGEAFTVLYDIADPDRQKQIVDSVPVTNFGIPCIFPQISDIQPYHNNAVWPFVQAYWTLASAKAQHEQSVLHGLGSIYRQSALFLTNKENFVAETGDFNGTAINSNRQLWSVAGNLAMVYKLYFGMDYKANGIEFKPFIPESFSGKKELLNFSYREMKLNLKIKGFGNKISSFLIDGKKVEKPFLNSEMKGPHTIEIQLSNISPETSSVNLEPIVFTEFPVIRPEINDRKYKYVEAELFTEISNLQYKGFSGKGFIELTKQKNTNVQFLVNVPQDGEYSIGFRYSNGSGPVNTDNKCCIRTLKSGDKFIGPVVMPQRGKDEWSNWGFSNTNTAFLRKGDNLITLSFEDWNDNMNGEINSAMLDYMRVAKLK